MDKEQAAEIEQEDIRWLSPGQALRDIRDTLRDIHTLLRDHLPVDLWGPASNSDGEAPQEDEQAMDMDMDAWDTDELVKAALRSRSEERIERNIRLLNEEAKDREFVASRYDPNWEQWIL